MTSASDRRLTPPVGGRDIALWAVGSAVLLGALAAWAQNRLIPLHGEYWGLFENGVDLDVYRHGAMAANSGDRPLYFKDFGDDLPFFFTYPPFAALVFTPLSWLGFESARAVWLTVSAIALVLAVYRCLRLCGPTVLAETARRRGSWRLLVTSVGLALAASAFEPVRSTLWYGQVNLVLLAVVLLDLARPESARLRGVGVGFAAGVKLTSLIFLPYLLVTRQWRAAGSPGGSFLATIGLGWLLDSGDSRVFWTRAINDVRFVAPRPTPANQSIAGVLDRLCSPTEAPTLNDPTTFAPNWLWLLVAATAGAWALWLAVRAHRRGDGLLALSLVGLVGCAVSPFSWGHHWVWFVPLAIWLFARAARGQWPAGLGFAALSAWVFMWTSVQADLPNAPVLPGYATGVFIQPSDPPLGALGQIKAAWYPIAFAFILLVGASSALLGRIARWRYTEDTGRNGSTKSSDRSTSPSR